MKVRPFRDCHAEYETSVGGYSEWAEFRRQFTPSNVAIIEFIPPLTIGLLWGALWGLGAAVAWMLRGFGIETRKPGESLTVMERLRGAGRWFVTPKNMLALSVGIVALAVSYYFLVSLPASNRDRLQFEKDTAAATKAERDSKEEAAAQAAQEQELSLQRCSDEADTAYWSYVKLNGKEIPDKPGTYSAPMFVWNAAEKQKTDALAECHRQYDPKK